MSNHFCKYCGGKFPSVKALITNICLRHPDGSSRGKHALYEGSEKSRYTCKYCGEQFPYINTLTTHACRLHPNGAYKGKHSPAL